MYKYCVKKVSRYQCQYMLRYGWGGPDNLQLLQRLFVGTPSVEAFGEAFRLLVLEREEELARTIGLLDSHVLDVHLKAQKTNSIVVVVQ